MKFYVEFEVFESVVGADLVGQARNVAGPVFGALMSDSRVIHSGHFSGKRGGFFIVEAGSGDELMEMFGPMYDMARLRMEPYSSFAALLEFFKKG